MESLKRRKRRPVVTVIGEALHDAGVECLPCEKVNLDFNRFSEYQDSQEHRAEEVFESPVPKENHKRLRHFDPSIPSMFRYFLDGSRRTYKIGDLLYKGRYLPMIGGQVGVGVLARYDSTKHRFAPMRDLCTFTNVIALPDVITEDDIGVLAERVKADTGQDFRMLRYKLEGKEERDPVDLGIAKIMDHMAQLELGAVHDLSAKGLLKNNELLIKDGPLRYKNIKGRGFDITQFRNVIGLSKTFRPSFAVGSGRRGGRKLDAGAITARLKFGERTIVFKTSEEDKTIGMWYLRIRPPEKMTNPLQGVVKVERFAIDTAEVEEGLDSERIDNLSSFLLRERNITPYGQDARWATHIYPIFLTETYVKSRLMSDVHFEALF